jgi:hypothetical protein
MKCNAMQCNAMQCNAMQCNAMQCNAMQCNAMQCNAKQEQTVKAGEVGKNCKSQWKAKKAVTVATKNINLVN